MFGGIIEKRIMSAIKAKIAIVEKDYKNGCEDIDKDAEFAKKQLADTLVESVIGKII